VSRDQPRPTISLVVVGDSLLDRDLDGSVERLAPDAPVPVIDQPDERLRPGGAALAATLAARDGRAVTFVTALGDDPQGRTVADLLARAGVTVLDVGLDGPTPQKVRVRAAGHPLLRLDYGTPDAAVSAPGPDALDALRSARALLVSDYGRGVAAHPELRAAIGAATDAGAKVTWDPHPNGATPTRGTRVVTPNVAEIRRLTGEDGHTVRAITTLAVRLRDRWSTAGVAVTLGERGALLVGGDGTPLMIPAPRLTGASDPCGAGDRFAAAVAGAMADGAVLSEAVVAAVATASRFVADGGAGGLGVLDVTAPVAGTPSAGPLSSVHDVIAATRARGGAVVATGGCFDLLHAGHVRLLDDARRLGDCLIVCVNSDASVARLKGPGRPVVRQQDRCAVLMGLSAVDAVVPFDEDTPERVLSELRQGRRLRGRGPARGTAARVVGWPGGRVALPRRPLHHCHHPGGCSTCQTLKSEPCSSPAAPAASAGRSPTPSPRPAAHRSSSTSPNPPATSSGCRRTWPMHAQPSGRWRRPSTATAGSMPWSRRRASTPAATWPTFRPPTGSASSPSTSSARPPWCAPRCRR
jgi:rfaE bifunctional protein kinase chain/domain/rfaE bifunctional protein nucleotidyltransferase chain/domain